jgi:hypothetical protein
MATIDPATVDPAWGARPDPMSLTNIKTGETIEPNFNPTEFEEEYGATYARQTVVGLGHQVLQFINTNNAKFDVELPFSAVDGGRAELARIARARIFLIAACHPVRANSILSGGAPRILFVWPNLLSLTCVLTNLKIKHTKFNRSGATVYFMASVTLEEIRDVNLLMEDIFALGTQHGAAGSQGG